VARGVVDNLVYLNNVHVVQLRQHCHLLGDTLLILGRGLVLLIRLIGNSSSSGLRRRQLFLFFFIRDLFGLFLLLYDVVESPELFARDDFDGVALARLRVDALPDLAVAADAEHVMKLVLVDHLVCAARALLGCQLTRDREYRLTALSFND